MSGESGENAPALCLSPRASRLTSVALSFAALALIFWGLHQLDMPLIRFMRSVHRPWLELGGDWLARLGSGAVLAAFSLSLLVIGRLRMRPALFHAGMQGLAAHGLAALATQLLKHAIGRPRPRVTHEGEFPFEPSFVSGFDSFPSGHASASFAVATVLAKQVPLGWLAYPVAALIACSRVWRGSHFPTDILVGTAVGILTGALVAYAYMDGIRLLSRTFARLILALALVFTLLWPMVQPASDHQEAWWLVGIGSTAMLAGLALRWRAALAGLPLSLGAWPSVPLMIGLASITGFWLVSAVSLLAALAWSLVIPDGVAQPDQACGAGLCRPGLLLETGVTVGAGCLAALFHSLSGLFPLL